MTKKTLGNAVAIGYLSIVISAHAVPAITLFDQSFSIPDGVVGDYVNAKTPSKNQFTLINSPSSGTWSVSEARLSLVKTAGGIANVQRAVDMEESPKKVLSFSVDLDFSFTVPEGTRLLTGSIGSDMTADGAWLVYGLDSASSESTWSVFGDRARNTFSGPQTLTIVLNSSDTEITYIAPDGESVMLSPNKWDLWVGKKGVFLGKSAVNPTLQPSQFGLGIGNDVGSGNFVFDNFRVQSISE